MRLPSIVAYTDAIAEINALPVAHSGSWFFHQGMLFLSLKKWWADFGTRHAKHEGLDIGIFRNRSGSLEWLETTTQIPAMAGGRVLNVCDDFLGQSVIVEHCSTPASRGVSVYSHLKVPNSIVPGKAVQKNQIIGSIADTTNRRSGIHCHLHISLMEIKNTIPDRKINWEIMGEPDPNVVKLFNPMV